MLLKRCWLISHFRRKGNKKKSFPKHRMQGNDNFFFVVEAETYKSSSSLPPLLPVVFSRSM